MPYYDLLPWGLPIAMIAAAIAWREARAAPEAATAAPPILASAGPGRE
jgi:hypothetical protein